MTITVMFKPAHEVQPGELFLVNGYPAEVIEVVAMPDGQFIGLVFGSTEQERFLTPRHWHIGVLVPPESPPLWEPEKAK